MLTIGNIPKIERSAVNESEMAGVEEICSHIQLCGLFEAPWNWICDCCGVEFEL